jgi:hypothetical protein
MISRFGIEAPPIFDGCLKDYGVSSIVVWRGGWRVGTTVTQSDDTP